MDENIDELERLAKPLVEFLRGKFHPHTQIIITDERAELLETTYGIPFPRKWEDDK